MNIQSDIFVSPTKWHLAHTTWFFEKIILRKFLKNYKPFNKKYDFIFDRSSDIVMLYSAKNYDISDLV